MENRENIIKQFFDSLIKKDISIIEKYFSENVIYIDSFGREYNGKKEVMKWFFDSNNNGNLVLKWDIKRIIKDKSTIVVEWYFEGKLNIYKNKIEQNDISHNGISIIDFNGNDKIEYIKEYFGGFD